VVAAQPCCAGTLSLILSCDQAGLPFWPGSGPWEYAHGTAQALTGISGVAVTSHAKLSPRHQLVEP